MRESGPELNLATDGDKRGFALDRLTLELTDIQMLIEAVHIEQLLMRALLHNFAVVND